MSPIDKLTESSLKIIQSAQFLASSENHQSILPEHIFYSILDDLLIQKLLISSSKANIEQLKEKTKKLLDKIPKVFSNNSEIFLHQESIKIIAQAQKIAEENKDDFISIETLFLSLYYNSIKIQDILKEHGLTKDLLRENIEKLRSGQKISSKTGENTLGALSKYTIDVTQKARDGKIDPVIGREDEIRRTIQVLSRRTKNNPILIGEPGVGKTAIIDGLAQRIVNHDVPESLYDIKLVAMDLAAMVAGAKFRGEFEERLKALISDVQKMEGKVVLFIDEAHMLIGAGAAEGSMDASNILKPMLARGDLHCIGATTLNEYKKYIEKDQALARRFQTIYVYPPTVNETISILRGLKEKYEIHHNIRISDNALISAATMSDRYISDRFLPDKAIDLIDEASSRLRIQSESKPELLDEIERKILQIKIEISALKKEKDEKSIEKSEKMELDLVKLEKEALDLRVKWHSEKKRNIEIKEIKSELEQSHNQLSAAQRSGDFTKASELIYGKIPNLTKKLSELESLKNNTMIQESVTSDDIALVVAKWTGIPITNLISSEKERLINMESYLSKSVVGQDEAISAISNAVRRSRAGLTEVTKPIGVFLFLGPTGVGKTELCKSLAEFLFQNSKSILRVDMSEYMEKHSVSKLLGAPPGYIGYEEGGLLTESIRRRPYQVILFDEIEKAHHDIFNIFLQLMDEGRLTDSKGNTVDCKNAIIIMTSNIGSSRILNAEDYKNKEEIRRNIMNDISLTFRPEFINRLDEILIFNKLLIEHIVNIVEIQLQKLKDTLLEKGITLNYNDEVLHFLAKKGYSNDFGARPLKRVIQSMVLDKIANEMITSSIYKESINLSINKDNIEISFK